MTPQTPLALLGGARHCVLEMQVEESDIVKVSPGQLVLVTLDSYKGRYLRPIEAGSQLVAARATGITVTPARSTAAPHTSGAAAREVTS